MKVGDKEVAPKTLNILPYHISHSYSESSCNNARMLFLPNALINIVIQCKI